MADGKDLNTLLIAESDAKLKRQLSEDIKNFSPNVKLDELRIPLEEIGKLRINDSFKATDLLSLIRELAFQKCAPDFRERHIRAFLNEVKELKNRLLELENN